MKSSGQNRWHAVDKLASFRKAREASWRNSKNWFRETVPKKSHMKLNKVKMLEWKLPNLQQKQKYPQQNNFHKGKGQKTGRSSDQTPGTQITPGVRWCPSSYLSHLRSHMPSLHCSHHHQTLLVQYQKLTTWPSKIAQAIGFSLNISQLSKKHHANHYQPVMECHGKVEFCEFQLSSSPNSYSLFNA